MKHYRVLGFEDAGPVFCFTVTAKNFSGALRKIEKDHYMSEMTFFKLEIREVENTWINDNAKNKPKNKH